MSLGKFIKDLHDKECNFKMSPEEVKDLEEVVTFIVKSYLPSTVRELSGNVYSIAEVINSGSYFEQTKIQEPNEFDFMLVVRELSDPAEIKLERGCKSGYTQAKVRDIATWPKTNTPATPEHSFQLAILQFNCYVRQALECTKEFSFKGNLGELSFNKVVSRGKPYKEFSYVQTAYLTWRRYKRKNEKNHAKRTENSQIFSRHENATDDNVDILYLRSDSSFNGQDSGDEHFSSKGERGDNVDILYLRSESSFNGQDSGDEHFSSRGECGDFENVIDVDVDLMACCHASLSEFGNMVQINPLTSSASCLLRTNGCHIVLKPCGNPTCLENDMECRLISYTKSEQVLMRNLSVDWKIVYKCFKWMFLYTQLLEIDSYKLKSSVLHMAEKYQSDRIDPDEALLLVLQHLKCCHSKCKMPSIFNCHLNVWNIKPCFYYFVRYHLTLCEKIFTGIQRTPLQEYDYRLFLSLIDQFTLQFTKVAPILLELEKGMNQSELEMFNAQGNAFLDVIGGMGPLLQRHKHFKNIARQMKFLIFFDVIKVLFKSLCMKVWGVVKRVVF